MDVRKCRRTHVHTSRPARGNRPAVHSSHAGSIVDTLSGRIAGGIGDDGAGRRTTCAADRRTRAAVTPVLESGQPRVALVAAIQGRVP